MQQFKYNMYIINIISVIPVTSRDVKKRVVDGKLKRPLKRYPPLSLQECRTNV